jgi:DNA-binding NarL/FixJ family response regulator
MKLVLADDNEIIRIGLRTVLRVNIPGLILFEANDSKELFDIVKSDHPDAVLLDYSCDNFSIKTIADIRAKYPETKVIGFTYLQSSEIIVNALKAGVMSYIKKDCDTQEIVDAVNSTVKGESFFCGTILDTIETDGLNIENVSFDPLSCEPISISDREVEIIRLIAEGLTNTQIAEKLFLSSHTIGTHRKNIMSKLGVKNTAGIVMYAIKTNLISPTKF